jgi:hypothetical protein
MTTPPPPEPKTPRRRYRKVPTPDNLNPAPEAGEFGETEAADIPPIDAAMLQDRIDEFSDFANITVESVPEEPRTTIERPDKLKKGDKPPTGAPSLDEWQDFIGRIVLKSLTDLFLSVALGDIQDELTPKEWEMISLTKQDLKEMSAPIATLAHKSKFGRRRGRAIIAAADSSEAVLALVFWMRRVNKIASKYRKQRRPAQPTQTIPGYVEESNSGTSGENGEQGTWNGAAGFGLFNPGTG